VFAARQESTAAAANRRAMPPSRRSGRARRRSGGRLGRLLALGCVILLALLYYRPVGSYLETRDALAQRRAEVGTLADRKQRLEEKLVQTRSGATLVRAARRLGLVKPGERLFIVRGIPEWRHAHARHRR
jgi:cell division protein FtsB